MSNSDLKKLQKIWYAKLKKDGFEDIEDVENDQLKSWSSDVFGSRKAQVQNGGWQAKAEYYYMATQFLEEYKFDNQMERNIWAYHSEGISARDIAATLKKTKVKKLGRGTVWKIIKKLKSSMYEMYLAPKKEYHEQD